MFGLTDLVGFSGSRYSFKRPTISITDNVTGSMDLNTTSVTFTFTFSEAVTGFVSNDIEVINGTKDTFSQVSTSVYTLVVLPIPNSISTIVINVPENVAFNFMGIGNQAASSNQAVNNTFHPGWRRGIIGYGVITDATTVNSITNLISDTGVIASDQTTFNPRFGTSAASYGVDKAVFGFGFTAFVGVNNFINLVSNTGVVQSTTSGVGTSRTNTASATFGLNKAIFAFGSLSALTTGVTAVSNIVSNTGVLSSDVAGVGTARMSPAAVEYGTLGKALFAFGSNISGYFSNINHVDELGTIASDTSVATNGRTRCTACRYGVDKGIIAFGSSTGFLNSSSLVSNTGQFTANVSSVGTARDMLLGSEYGMDKGVMVYGVSFAGTWSRANYISEIGVVAADVFSVGTARHSGGGSGYSV